MTYFFDTSIFVAAFDPDHIKHHKCRGLMQEAKREKITIATSTHALAELYSVLTKLPVPNRLPPSKARQVTDLLAQNYTIIDLNKSDYQVAIARCENKGLVSGAVYDALHIIAAEKLKVDKVYTLNGKDFIRFGIDESIELVAW